MRCAIRLRLVAAEPARTLLSVVLAALLLVLALAAAVVAADSSYVFSILSYSTRANFDFKTFAFEAGLQGAF
jgi:hypothetical protein